MIRLYLALVFFVLATQQGVSQVNKTNVSEFERKLYVRLNLLGLADVLDHNLSTGIEYRFHPHWSTGTDAGWIFASSYLTTNKGANGLLVRPFIRFYPDKDGIGFFEAELHYKYVAYRMEDWLGRLPVNGVATYQEFTKFNYNKNAAGAHIKGGLQTEMNRNKTLLFDFTGGIGVRWKSQGVKDGIYNEQGGGITDIFNPAYSGPVVLLNMRLLYRIR